MRDRTRPEDIVSLDVEIGGFLRDHSLSPREGEVFCLLLSGVTTAEHVGKILNISPHTVNNHLKSMFQKTATPNKTEIVALFVRSLLTKLNHCKMFAKQPKVLIVDDDVEVTAVIEAFLTQRGVTVYAFNDPVKALPLIQEVPLDFVISDVSMPKLSGIELLAEIRRIHRVLPMVIFISGFAKATVEDSLTKGAIAFIEKPLNLNKLFFTIMEHFIEGSFERSRLLRVDTIIPSTVNDMYKFMLSNIGFGGVFLPFGEQLKVAERRFKVGELIDVAFDLGDPERPIKARGEVVWRRDRATLGVPPGVGVKFVDVKPMDQELIEQYVRVNKIVSHIPLASRPDAGLGKNERRSDGN